MCGGPVPGVVCVEVGEVCGGPVPGVVREVCGGPVPGVVMCVWRLEKSVGGLYPVLFEKSVGGLYLAVVCVEVREVCGGPVPHPSTMAT